MARALLEDIRFARGRGKGLLRVDHGPVAFNHLQAGIECIPVAGAALGRPAVHEAIEGFVGVGNTTNLSERLETDTDHMSKPLVFHDRENAQLVPQFR
jgi:hypothetical protein